MSLVDPQKPLAKFYDSQFYDMQCAGSFRSALKYRDVLLRVFKPTSIVDVGCGRGTWLKAFKDSGATRLLGCDGPWVAQESLVDTSIDFLCVDLDNPSNIPHSQPFDLAISVEVAEHIRPESSNKFILKLTQLADVVLFGAAYLGQGGTNHINEQKHAFWANIFLSYNYLPFDLFRPVVWGDDEIEFWYRQNTFLYVSKDSPVLEQLASAGHNPIRDISFMNCIHPTLYEAHINYIRILLGQKR